MGGGMLFRSLLELGLVDTVEVGISPLLLGQGVPLAPTMPRSVRLELTLCEPYPSGLVVLHYSVGRDAAVMPTVQGLRTGYTESMPIHLRALRDHDPHVL